MLQNHTVAPHSHCRYRILPPYGYSTVPGVAFMPPAVLPYCEPAVRLPGVPYCAAPPVVGMGEAAVGLEALLVPYRAPPGEGPAETDMGEAVAVVGGCCCCWLSGSCLKRGSRESGRGKESAWTGYFEASCS